MDGPALDKSSAQPQVGDHKPWAVILVSLFLSAMQFVGKFHLSSFVKERKIIPVLLHTCVCEANYKE